MADNLTTCTDKPPHLTQDKPKNKGVTKVAIDYTLAATMKTSGMSYRQIAEQIGCSPGSLKIGFIRKGLHKQVAKVRDHAIAKGEQYTHDTIQSASERVKGKIADKIERIADKLSEIPEKQKLTDLKAQTEVIESLTRSSKPVFGWGDESTIGLIAVSLPEPGASRVIDITSQSVVSPRDNTSGSLSTDSTNQLPDCTANCPTLDPDKDQGAGI